MQNNYVVRMKQLFVILIVLAATTAVQAQSKKSTAKTGTTKPATSGNTSASLERGKAVYAANCLTCHQPDGGGVPNLNPPLQGTKWVKGNKTTLVQLVLKGSKGQVEIDGETYHNAMPAQAHLTDEQIADVLTYVRKNFGNKASTVTPADVKAVRAKTK
jgi:mono/diheme cytochrome c family protein